MAKREGSTSPGEFAKKYGPWALVTGAAQGIGRAYAEALAQRAVNVAMVDLQRDLLVHVSRQIVEATGVQVQPIALDLSKRDFIRALLEQTERLSIGLLVCNAALGQEGLFLEQSLDNLLLTTEVNCNAPLILTHTFAKRMAAQGRGGIILTASGSALQGSPTFAHYAATKAYNLVLGEALWYELRAHGVDVLSFIPGPTNTPALRKRNPGLKEGVSVGPIQLPAPTAEAALRALGKGPCAARDVNFARRLAHRRRAIEQMGERFMKPKPGTRWKIKTVSSARPVW